MAKFEMEIELDVHAHSPHAHRAFIQTALQQVAQAVGTNVHDEGDVTVPPHTVIGSWRISGHRR
jgi:hypothetical protein